MGDELVSIIVPIYGVEKYLNKCVDSIISQTYLNLEIILVDDGSKDSCPRICDEYTQIDNRVKVIHKTNGGLSDARNVGLSIAKGEYIAFIDSDDFISNEFIRTLYKLCKDNDADIAVSDFVMFNDYNDLSDTLLDGDFQIYEHRDKMNNFFNKNCAKSVVAWNKLYKRSLFDEIAYPKGRNFEDEATTYKVFYKARRVVYTKSKLYYYLQRSDSIMGRVLSEQNLLAFASLEEVVMFYKEQQDRYFEKKAKIRFFKTLSLYRLKLEKSKGIYAEKDYEMLKKKLNDLYNGKLDEFDFSKYRYVFAVYSFCKRFLER